MQRLLLYCFVLATVLSGCKKESPFLSPEEAQELIDAADPGVQHIVFGMDKTIYYLEDLESDPVAIAGPFQWNIVELRISHDHSKVAYRTEARMGIVGTDGSDIAEILSFGGALQMDWSANDETLWVLDWDDQIRFWGPEMNLPPLTVPNGSDVVSAAVSITNDLAYVTRPWGSPSDNSQAKLHLKSANGSRYFQIGAPETPGITYVNYSGHGQDLAVGIGPSTSHYRIFDKLQYYTSISEQPEQTFESSRKYSYPTYRSDIGYEVMGMRWLSVQAPFLFVRKFWDANGTKEIEREEYVSPDANRPFVVDWK